MQRAWRQQQAKARLQLKAVPWALWKFLTWGHNVSVRSVPKIRELIRPKGAWRFVTTPSMAVIAVFVSCRWDCLCLLSLLLLSLLWSLLLLLLLLLLFCGCGCDASDCDRRGRHCCLGRRSGRGRVVVVVVGGGGSGYRCRFLSSSSLCGCNQRLCLDRFCSHWVLLHIVSIFLSFSHFVLASFCLRAGSLCPPLEGEPDWFSMLESFAILHFWILLLIPIDNDYLCRKMKIL